MKAKKNLGQNFLVDNSVINNIVNEITAYESDLVIEIGPGRGALTKKLKEKNSMLIAYEYDTDLRSVLTELEDNKTKIIYKDILKTDIKTDIKDIKYTNLYLVGNLPYYITTPIIEHIIKQNLVFNKFTIMIQKEVADRFMAEPKNKEYGYFTLFLKYYFNIKKVCDVSKSAFIPMPKVYSTVISLIPRDNKPLIDNTEKYFIFLKEAFSQKRKTLKNNLGKYDWNIISNILKKYNLSETVRAEEISEDIFIEIYNNLVK